MVVNTTATTIIDPELYLNLVYDVKNHWIFYAGSLVLTMLAGFSLLEAGSISAKNATDVLYKNVLVGSLITAAIHLAVPQNHIVGIPM